MSVPMETSTTSMPSECAHSSKTRSPNQYDKVHKEECTKCFQTDRKGGVNVCLTCFNGSCDDHAAQHCKISKHNLVLSIQTTVVDTSTDTNSSNNEQSADTNSSNNEQSGGEETTEELRERAKVILGDQEEVKHELHVFCKTCDVELDYTKNDALANIVHDIMAIDAATKPKTALWGQDDKIPCDHAKNLTQSTDNPVDLSSKGDVCCSKCDINSGLWLCLECGHVGCGRKLYGGLGGNGHAVGHFETTNHPFVVKLGTISEDGADCYCYSCNEDRSDPLLAEHLATYGINIKDVEKTEYTQEELELKAAMDRDFFDEVQKKHESSRVDENEWEVSKKYGTGYTGLTNLGNSCYIASCLQVLAHLPSFQHRYVKHAGKHARKKCKSSRPAGCFECQMFKLFDGLTSGKYSQDSTTTTTTNNNNNNNNGEKKDPVQRGIAPRMWKSLVCRDHNLFSGGKQQDAAEFFQWLMTLLEGKKHPKRKSKSKSDASDSKSSDKSSQDVDTDVYQTPTFDAEDTINPTVVFNLTQQTRSQCQTCKGVKYADSQSVELPLDIPTALQKERKSTETEESSDKDDQSVQKNDQDGGDTKKKDEAKSLEPIAFADLVASWSAGDAVELKCPSCKSKTQFARTNSIIKFPDILHCVIRRFTYEGWTPRKIDCDFTFAQNVKGVRTVTGPTGGVTVDFAGVKGKGAQEGETLLVNKPEEKKLLEPDAVLNDETKMLVGSFGWHDSVLKKAVNSVSNPSDISALMDWVGTNITDPSKEAQIRPTDSGGSSGPVELSSEAIQVRSVVGDHLTDQQLIAVMKHCNNDVSAAISFCFDQPDKVASMGSEDKPEESKSSKSQDQGSTVYELFGVIEHRGKSTHKGHYVAWLWLDGHWVEFNDAKVLSFKSKNTSSQPADLAGLKVGHGYMYFFRRLK